MTETKPRRRTPVTLTFTEPANCSLDLRLRILSRLPFFKGLSEQDLHDINQRCIELGFEPGQYIYHEGDPAEHLYVVAEGKVRLLRHTFGGRDVLLDMLTTGDFFGNLASQGTATHTDTAHALTQACILSINTQTFSQILDEHPKLARKTLEIMAGRLNDANQRLLQLSALPAEQRITSALLKLATKLGKRKGALTLIDAPLSRSDLAEMAGTTPETVSRTLSQLSAAGLIESGRQWVAIEDLKALEDFTNAQ